MVLYLESRVTTVRRLVQMTKEDAKTLVLYQTEDGAVTLEVSVEDDTVWLTQMQMAERFKEIFPLFPGILRMSFRKKWRKKAICIFCNLHILINRLPVIAWM
mgnify:CR=1 FL=1